MRFAPYQAPLGHWLVLDLAAGEIVTDVLGDHLELEDRAEAECAADLLGDGFGWASDMREDRP